MSTRELITTYALKFADGKISEIGEMLDDQAEYWVQGVGTFGKAEIMGIMQGILGKVEHAHTEVIDVIEMGPKAAAIMRTSFKLKSGEDVVDDLCLVGEVSNGKLIRVREYLDQSVLPHFMG